MLAYKLDDQIKIIVASMAIHNYIRKHIKHDEEFNKKDNDDDYIPFVVKQ